MDWIQIYIIILLLCSTVCYGIYYYVFSIYEIIYRLEPNELYSDYSSKIKLSIIPLNSIGKKVPIRYSRTKFEIKSGDELVNIITENCKKGQLIIQTKHMHGKVIVLFKSEHALFPSSVEINIFPKKEIIKDKSIKNL